MKRFFISYSSIDKRIVEDVCSCLEDAGLECWYAHRNIQPTEIWADAIIRGLNISDVMILVLTDHSIKSEEVASEVCLARQKNLKIIVFKLTDSELSNELRYYLARVHWMDAISIDMTEAIENLRDFCLGIVGQNYELSPSLEESGTADYVDMDIETLIHKVRQGDHMAQFELSERYYDGDGVIENEAEFFRLLQLSAKGGNINAITRLGYCYEHGIATEIDFDKAIENYIIAVESYHPLAMFYLGRLFYYGKGVDQNIDEAIRLYKLAADHNVPGAERSLGICYEFGEGVKQDPSKAIEMYRRAADHGDSIAQCNLAFLYKIGKFVDKDYNESLKYYQLSVEQEYERAEYELGCMYLDGIGVEQDTVFALELMKQSAEQGYEYAQARLGELYLDGKIVERDYCEALKYFTYAADEGNVASLFYMGLIFANGWGVEQDYAAAIEYYTKAVNSGNVYAYNNLAVLYNNGLGVEKDPCKAAELYKRSADGGNVSAMYNLAHMYQTGEGVDKDLTEAARLYREAAEKGYEPAMHMLGECYYYGDGVDADNEKAFGWFSKAAYRNDTDAQAWLGFCYLDGIGTDKDLSEAETWLMKALESGSRLAELGLGRLYLELEQYEEAVPYLIKAEKNGSVTAGYELGMCYFNGTGVPVNKSKAFNLFINTAGRSSKAAFMTGKCLQYGYGVQPNEDMSWFFYEQAAKAGHKKASEIMKVHDVYMQILKILSIINYANAPRLIKTINGFIEDGTVGKFTEKQLDNLIYYLEEKAKEIRDEAIQNGASRYDPDSEYDSKKMLQIAANLKEMQSQY